jgi:hypothetical protein
VVLSLPLESRWDHARLAEKLLLRQRDLAVHCYLARRQPLRALLRTILAIVTILGYRSMGTHSRHGDSPVLFVL